jgi:hypothetical protein
MVNLQLQPAAGQLYRLRGIGWFWSAPLALLKDAFWSVKSGFNAGHLKKYGHLADMLGRAVLELRCATSTGVAGSLD